MRNLGGLSGFRGSVSTADSEDIPCARGVKRLDPIPRPPRALRTSRAVSGWCWWPFPGMGQGAGGQPGSFGLVLVALPGHEIGR
ncbi:hypothetical protein GCM10010168_84250 [Actinoplanes ianthinogenes]|uniref:Uncharacterized protein n=1 Tax=Actinoplanes ianthinogenes TaxID=122358 RepID=A0ABN6CHH6_9ACTN|nr:hypothetical protein Aiant_56580 [Actinoplanes ianthinogenes]GGR52466.1 hypothetical protein GCM10010168_84250 [Actinoplanes ianthinogenes]